MNFDLVGDNIKLQRKRKTKKITNKLEGSTNEKVDRLYALTFSGIVACVIFVILIALLSKSNNMSYDDFSMNIQTFEQNYTPTSSTTESVPEENSEQLDDVPDHYVISHPDEPNDNNEEDLSIPPESEPSKNSSTYSLSDAEKKAIKYAQDRYDVEYGKKYKGIVNINMASLDMLQSLPGVGEATALAIMEYRFRNHGFRSIEEIMEVKGIGEKKFEIMKDRISIKQGE